MMASSFKGQSVDNTRQSAYVINMKKEDIKSPRPSLFNLRQLSLLHWMLSAPEGMRRFMVDSGRVRKFYETGAPREDGLLPVKGFSSEDGGDLASALRRDFGGSFKFEPWDLVNAGLLTSHSMRFPNMPAETVCFQQKVSDIYLEPPGRWASTPVYYGVAGEWVVDWFREKGEPRRTKLLAASREKEASLTRRAVFGCTLRIVPTIPKEIAGLLPKKYRFELPGHAVVRPCMVATIIGETEKRFKVRDVESINGNPTNLMGLEIKREKFVEREYLLLDNVTDEDVARLAAFDEEYVREVEEIGRVTALEIIPIVARMADRLAQKKGQQKDMLAALISSLNSSKN
jgi:hypothetical protein